MNQVIQKKVALSAIRDLLLPGLYIFGGKAHDKGIDVETDIEVDHHGDRLIVTMHRPAVRTIISREDIESGAYKAKFSLMLSKMKELVANDAGDGPLVLQMSELEP